MTCLSASCEQGTDGGLLVRFRDVSSGAEISSRVSLIKEYLRSVRTREGLCMAIDDPDEAWRHSPPAACGIEPFGAFGSGLHETTSGCLALMEDFAEEIPDRTGIAVLDIGTGTGILSLAAYRLGMRRITAIDVSVRAVIAAFHNFNLHGISREVDLRLADIRTVSGEYDLVLANLRFGILSGMLEQILLRMGPGGTIIVSGIRQEEAGQFDILVSHTAVLAVERTVERNGWISCALRKGGTGWQGRRA